MTKRKVAITLEPDLLAKAKRAVRSGRADSLSAYVAAALEEKTKLDDLDALLREMLAETGGPPTAEERREAQEKLGLRKPRRKQRRVA